MELEEWFRHLKRGATGSRPNGWRYTYDSDSHEIICTELGNFVDSQPLDWYRANYRRNESILTVNTAILIGGE